MKARFDAESNDEVGSDKLYRVQLDRDTKAALDRLSAAYAKNGKKIVDLLVHHVTTVEMKVPDNIAQCIRATESQH